MELFFDATDATAVSDLRTELGRYFRRHGTRESGYEGADLAVSELVTNVVRHAPGPAWMHVDWTERRPRVEIHDLGPGFAPPAGAPAPSAAAGGNGLYLVSRVANELRTAAKRAGGSKVSALMPVLRAVQRDHDPPRGDRNALPAPEEAAADGTFGREPFLRALVVHLADAVERQNGPDAAEAAVAAVGASVGGRMEDEYRRARAIVERLDLAQITDLYIRLKAAIGGDFYLVEAGDDKIVLGNRARPFGDAVKRAPGLCRMTSSVFGGIAARNTGGAAVVLEERIAVGDPECRIVIWLGADKTGRWEAAHDYDPDPAAGSEDRGQ